jgi:hypothetical protein
MTVNLERRVAVAAVTRGITKVWAVNDPAGTRPQVLMPEPDDQRNNHYRQVQRNHHSETDVFDREYFEEISRLLSPAKEILLVGHGKGKANEMLKLVQYLERYHADTARKIVGAVDTNLESLTDAEILDFSKDWFAEPIHAR